MNNSREQLPNGGRCQCAWQHLSSLMTDKIIYIIDSYSHRADHICDAIVDYLKPKHVINWEEDNKKCELLRKRKAGGNVLSQEENEFLETYNKRWGLRQYWSNRTGMMDASFVFAGNHRGKFSFDMCDFTSRDSMLTDGATCGIKLSESLDFPIIYISGSYLTSDWLGEHLTPFNRKNRRVLKQFINNDVFEVEQCMKYNPFDVMCDGAHATLWSWFHCNNVIEVE